MAYIEIWLDIFQFHPIASDYVIDDPQALTDAARSSVPFMFD